METQSQIGNLKLISKHRDKGKTKWLCLCDCGSEKLIREDAIKNGSTVSCGCYSIRKTVERNTTHGLSKNPGYHSWHSMMTRCYVPEHDSYANYGGRGISVCKRWHKPENFLLDMGTPDSGMQIDRVHSDGNYELGNCKWSSPKENSNNKRNTRWITVNGVTKTASEWAEVNGVPLKTIHVRLHRGWSESKAVQSTNFKLKENKNG